MTADKRVAVFLDGSNFYHILRDPRVNLRNLLQYDYKRLADWLARGRRIVSLQYYIGVVRAKPEDIKGQRMRSDQQRLFAHLKKQGWNVVLGHMMQYDDGVFHEKGVDVLIALDILEGAYQGSYDTAVLISSDTDLLPAISRIQERGKSVEYVGSSYRPSFGMIKHANEKRLLTKEDLAQFASSTA